MWERLRKFKYQAQYKSKWILSYDWLDSIVVSLAIYPFILNPIYKKKRMNKFNFCHYKTSQFE